MKKKKFKIYVEKAGLELCLRHTGLKAPMDFCEHVDMCQRNLILREHLVVEGDVVHENACVVGLGIVRGE